MALAALQGAWLSPSLVGGRAALPGPWFPTAVPADLLVLDQSPPHPPLHLSPSDCPVGLVRQRLGLTLTQPLLLSGPPRPTPFLGGISPHPSASAPSLSFLICKVQATVVPLMGAGQSWRPWCVPPSPGLSLGLSQAHCPFISDADAGLA